MARAGRQFLPVDVNYFDDPRVVELSDLAQLLDLKAMLLMKRIHSDGSISHRQLERIAPSGGEIGAMIGELVEVGLYEDATDALIRNAWSSWNDGAAEVEAMAAGGSYGNHVKWHVKRRKPNPDCPHCAAADQPDSGSDSPPDRPPNRRQRGDIDIDKTITTRAQPSAEAVGDSASITSLEAFEGDFNLVWANYPRKVNRKGALRAYAATRRRGADPVEIAKAVTNYALAVRGRAQDKIKHGATFFGPDEPWTDYVTGVPSGDSPLAPPAMAGSSHPDQTW